MNVKLIVDSGSGGVTYIVAMNFGDPYPNVLVINAQNKDSVFVNFGLGINCVFTVNNANSIRGTVLGTGTTTKESTGPNSGVVGLGSAGAIYFNNVPNVDITVMKHLPEPMKVTKKSLQIAGGAGNDAIVLSTDPTIAGSLIASVNGQVVFDGPATTISNIVVDTGSGADRVYVQAVPAGHSVQIIEHEAGSVIDFGAAGSVQNILSDVSIFNTDGLSTVTVDNSADTFARNVTVDASGITGLAPGRILYDQASLAALNVKIGSGQDMVNVQATPNIGPVPWLPTNLVVGGNSVVVVGKKQSLNQILGDLFISAVADGAAITIDDSADQTSRVVTLGEPEQNIDELDGLAPVPIRFSSASHGSVTVNASRVGNTFDIYALGNLAFTINSGSIKDAVNVGDTFGTLDSILGILSITGLGKGTPLSILRSGQRCAANVQHDRPLGVLGRSRGDRVHGPQQHWLVRRQRREPHSDRRHPRVGTRYHICRPWRG